MTIPGARSIILLVPSNRRRGAEVFGERLAEGLARAGWQVDFVALHGATSDRVVSATPLALRDQRGRLDLGTVRKLRRRIRDTRPAIILANGGTTLRYAVAAASVMPSKPVLAFSSIGEPRYWLRSKTHTRIQSFLHRRADVVLAVSHETATQLTEILGVDPERVHVARTGVPDTYFVPHEHHEKDLRLLFLGSLSTEKNPMGAVHVALRLRERHDVQLRLVGDGPLASEISAFVAKSDAGHVIKLTGSVEDVTTHLAWADLLLLTSRTEGLPGAVLEAAAAGVPTIGFDVGGTRETMNPGTTGLLLPPGDLEGMVSEVERLAGSHDERIRMGEEATALIRNEFGLARSIQTYDEILTRSLESNRRQ